MQLNPFAPSAQEDPNYVETGIWKASSDGKVLIEIQGGLGDPTDANDDLSESEVGLIINYLFFDSLVTYDDIVWRKVML